MHAAVVGQGDSRLAHFFGASNQVIDFTQAVEQRVFAMNVEVDEIFGGGCHGQRGGSQKSEVGGRKSEVKENGTRTTQHKQDNVLSTVEVKQVADCVRQIDYSLALAASQPRCPPIQLARPEVLRPNSVLSPRSVPLFAAVDRLRTLRDFKHGLASSQYCGVPYSHRMNSGFGGGVLRTYAGRPPAWTGRFTPMVSL